MWKRILWNRQKKTLGNSFFCTYTLCAYLYIKTFKTTNFPFGRNLGHGKINDFNSASDKKSKKGFNLVITPLKHVATHY